MGSIETTRGLIRLMAGEAFIFVSGITDRFGHFNQDLGPRTAAQNFLAVHNAGNCGSAGLTSHPERESKTNRRADNDSAWTDVWRESSRAGS